MADRPAPLDDLVVRLRERAADPEHRVDAAPSSGSSRMRSLPIGAVFGRLTEMRGDLARLVEPQRAAGPVDPRLVAKADALGRVMSRRALHDVPPPVDAARLAAAEAALGFALPLALRRIYAEVGDGRFGPGSGLLPLDEVVATYRDFRKEPAGPDGAAWPEKLLPVVEDDPRYDCIDASSGAVVAWDPEEIELLDRRGWKRSFRTAAPSVEAWLDAWLRARPAKLRMADRLHAAEVRELRERLARLRATSPQRLAEMGLSEGWEERMIRDSGVDPSEL